MTKNVAQRALMWDLFC